MEDFEQAYRKADQLAEQAHSGQKDKAGNDYITHPRRVAELCSTPLAKVTALLHDVLEDTDVTEEEMREQFGDTITEKVLLMTHESGVPYMDYVRALADDDTAREVKIADLRHNMDLSRCNPITERDVQRVIERYYPAYCYLMEVDNAKKGKK